MEAQKPYKESLKRFLCCYAALFCHEEYHKGIPLRRFKMAHSNSVDFSQSPSSSFKPLYAILDFFTLISAAWEEAKALEQESHKNSANW